MTDQVSPEITSDDKLWAALSYPIWFLPIILMLMDDKKDRPFIKAHGMQALIFGLILNVISGVLAAVLIGCAIWVFGIGIQLYWAFKAYNGEYVTIPVLTEFIQKQGWA